MKPTLLLGFLLNLGAPLFCAEAPPRILIPKVVDALKEVERGPGSNPWQIENATWAQYSRIPQSTASLQEHRAVATEHAIWCMGVLPRLKLPATVESIALVWNAGFGTIDQRKTQPRHRDFANRVANIYSTL